MRSHAYVTKDPGFLPTVHIPAKTAEQVAADLYEEALTEVQQALVKDQDIVWHHGGGTPTVMSASDCLRDEAAGVPELERLWQLATQAVATGQQMGLIGALFVDFQNAAVKRLAKSIADARMDYQRVSFARRVEA